MRDETATTPKKKKKKTTKRSVSRAIKRDPNLDIAAVIRYMEELNDGHDSAAAVIESTMPIVVQPESDKEYREFIPQPLPATYRYMTSKWLYSSLFWRTRVEALRARPKDSMKEKLQLGLAVAVLILFVVVIFLTMVIAMG